MSHIMLIPETPLPMARAPYALCANSSVKIWITGVSYIIL